MLDVLNIAIERIYEGYTTIDINFLNRSCTISQFTNKQVTYTFSEEIATELIEKLRLIDLMRWESVYLNPDQYEGTRWSVELIVSSNRTKKYGVNAYPPLWDAFNQVIEAFILRVKSHT